MPKPLTWRPSLVVAATSHPTPVKGAAHSAAMPPPPRDPSNLGDVVYHNGEYRAEIFARGLGSLARIRRPRRGSDKKRALVSVFSHVVTCSLRLCLAPCTLVPFGSSSIARSRGSFPSSSQGCCPFCRHAAASPRCFQTWGCCEPPRAVSRRDIRSRAWTPRAHRGTSPR